MPRSVTQDYVYSFIEAVQEGYNVIVVTGDIPMLSVENPKFKEDDGSDMYIVLQLKDRIDEQ